MTERGEATRKRLIAATRQVVREVGYTRATTRAIARAADVTEGTIYRHFPDKTTLFFAAALGPHEQILAEFADLPARAGENTLTSNLTAALTRLAVLRDDIVPLELAIMSDPDLAAARTVAPTDPLEAGHGGPPERLAEYLAAEQRLGRLRADLDPAHVSRTLLTLLFALALQPAPPETTPSTRPDPALIASTVDLLVHGLAPDTDAVAEGKALKPM